MIKTTKEQRAALWRIFNRKTDTPQSLTYRQFRKTVAPGSGYIMVHWCGMYLGIELDGYTHS